MEKSDDETIGDDDDDSNMDKEEGNTDYSHFKSSMDLSSLLMYLADSILSCLDLVQVDTHYKTIFGLHRNRPFYKRNIVIIE